MLSKAEGENGKTGASDIQPPNSPHFDPKQWVEKHGDYLYRFALLRVHNPQIAEDMVQETFLAALKSNANFEGRSSERTWLTGILKNKIIDHYRKNVRTAGFSETLSAEDVLQFGT
ncbi:MAG: RNA polymerase sigma factor [Acidobacteria bacterium]|nr:RNA polymerase sigma factor [Acidobacteriota bacterium]